MCTKDWALFLTMPLIVIVSGLIRDVSVVLTGAVTSEPLIHSAKSFTVQPVFVSRHLEDSEAKDETFNLLTSGQTCCPTPINKKKNPTTITVGRWTPAGPKCRNYFWERVRMPCRHFGSRHRRGLQSTTMLVRRGSTTSGSRGCLEENIVVDVEFRAPSWPTRIIELWEEDRNSPEDVAWCTIFYNTATTVTQTLIEFYKTQTKEIQFELLQRLKHEIFADLSWNSSSAYHQHIFFPLCVYPSFSLV